ncbi:general stress protein CsbD [Thioalkalivibrio versutus]|uniref:General stress protein CsbD n=1 Tax=Thioalkalivibrio versutus TaxID=106634 RepID=A0A0G3G6Z0_9GAMM|nr:CsbD family protein [Thioalkalivibrio versutus]AKJ95252.1 general stress protein CsbD [Thioalkalivibrio versutus]
MNKDQIKGRVEEAKGQAKQTAGKVVGNEELEVKGRAQKAGGKLQAGYGDLKKDIKDST